MFVVMGVPGKTGSTVANQVLAAGKPLRVVMRSAETADEWRGKGAEVAIADIADTASLEAAFAGADGVYVLFPPSFVSDDYIGLNRGYAASIANALRTAKPKHVVFLSSVGAQHEDGTGPIRTNHLGEVALREVPVLHSFVRSAYMLDNTFGVAGVVKAQGIYPVFHNPDKTFEMVTSDDVGRVAADTLLSPPEASQVIEVSGPGPTNYREIAAHLSKALGREIPVVQVPAEGVLPGLQQAGFSPNMAALYQQMFQGIDSGHVDFERAPGMKFVRGTVSVADFVENRLVHATR